MKTMMKHARAQSLLLIDEVGGGTLVAAHGGCGYELAQQLLRMVGYLL